MTSLAARHIELWVEERDGSPAINPVIRSLLERLRGAGAAVSVRIAERHVTDARCPLGKRPPDLILLKSATTLALSVAAAAEPHGGRFLNEARATLRAHDKAAAIARLAAEGLPVPETFLQSSGIGFTSSGGSRFSSRDSDGVWITKPARGTHGHGVSTHASLRAALDAPAIPAPGGSFIREERARLVQRKVGNHGPDLKVYVAAARCFAGWKRFRDGSYLEDGIEQVSLDAATARLTLDVGDVLGLRCFGVDLRFVEGRATIIDVNPFPGYRGFPEAAQSLFQEVARALHASKPSTPAVR